MFFSIIIEEALKRSKVMSMKDRGEDLHHWIQELFPISRSIVGQGYDDSLKFIDSLIPSNSNILEYATGFEANGWCVPQAWKVEHARLQSMSGEVILDFEDCNLHLWSHSISFQGIVSRESLEPHLLTSSRMPSSVPYATTYYKPNWGFSLTEDSKFKLTDDEYYVDIKTELSDGSLKILEFLLPGKSEKEILITSYICHPSMANNELSGPVLLAALARYLNQTDRNYSYRFILGPETIGPICYLSDNLKKLKANVVAGLNLTCVGGGSEWSLLHSQYENSLIDSLALNLMKNHLPHFKTFPFLERGSDERQYCSPAVDIPMISIMRSKYHEYDEYHTSADDLSFVTPARLQETLDFYQILIDTLDGEGIYTSTSVGEPFLSSKFSYPSIGGFIPANQVQPYKVIQNIHAFARASSLTSLAERMNMSAFSLLEFLRLSVSEGLVKKTFHNKPLIEK